MLESKYQLYYQESKYKLVLSEVTHIFWRQRFFAAIFHNAIECSVFTSGVVYRRGDISEREKGR